MKKLVSAFINKGTGEGVVTIGDAMFATSKGGAKIGSMVLIVAPELSFGCYKQGDGSQSVRLK